MAFFFGSTAWDFYFNSFLMQGRSFVRRAIMMLKYQRLKQGRLVKYTQLMATVETVDETGWGREKRQMSRELVENLTTDRNIVI